MAGTRPRWAGLNMGSALARGLTTHWSALDPMANAWTSVGPVAHSGSAEVGRGQLFAASRAESKLPVATFKTERFSACVWCTPTVTTRGDMFGRWNTSPVPARQFVLLQGVTSRTFSFYVAQSGGVGIKNVDALFSVGSTYCVVGTFDGSALTLYVNGVSKGSVTLGSPADTAGNTNLWVGSSSDSVYSGIIHNATHWSRCLSASEAWALYDPRTRWELYRAPTRRFYVDVPASFNPSWARGANTLLGGSPC